MKQDMHAPLPRDLRVDPVTGMQFVRVPGGSFLMGGENCGGSKDYLLHGVCLDGFYLGKYPVTQGQWRAVMGNNPSHHRGEHLPVEQVSWHDAKRYVTTLNILSGRDYRLPTEAEWECAAKGGKRHGFAGTDNYAELGNYGWYEDNSGGQTHPVGEKAPNPFGLYDMSGNVWEWVEDYFGEHYYDVSPLNKPTGPADGVVRVARGGAFGTAGGRLRTFYRFYYSPEHSVSNLGFRLALSA